jgi:hypothetical protein
MRSDVLRGWRTDHVLWVEVFALANLAFLALDIYIAHSENGFLRRAEWVPLFFSLTAPLLLVIALWAGYFCGGEGFGARSATWWARYRSDWDWAG